MTRRVGVGVRSRGVLAALLIMATAVLAPGLSGAEEPGDGDADRVGRMVGALAGQEGDSTALAPAQIPLEYLDEAGKSALKASLKAYYDYRTEGFEHRRRVFAWQLMSSKVIFVIVVALVAVGIYFSWLQFRQGLRRPPGAEQAATTLEASTTGIKVTSPVLGIIILVISLAFFYLYLDYVYPIEEIL